MLVITAVLFSCNVEPSKIFKAGTQLVYEVHKNDKAYSFTVIIKELESTIVFDWEMGKPLNKKGGIIIKPIALDTSRAIKNNFWSDQVEELKYETSVWVSDRIYNEIKTKGETTISTFGIRYPTKVVEKFSFKTMLNGKLIELPVIKLKSDYGYIFTILDNKENPIIIDMKTDFTVTLKEIKVAN